ncbi:TPA: hypothetical protein IXS78_002496 [Enterococcus faecium]|nr:hypothetical protein [Enterococcus faecium]MCZ1504381.1 hypothetical protein [Enterococcus faecium]RBT03962.1 hypothetical protein EA89_02479 [Enterococcus faecium]ROZ00187.1 hypothetical protein EGW79_04945 [Enterococcus faecium]ROZ00261.1 hypothetical protein EGW94_04945 [Enterococcus faecium]
MTSLHKNQVKFNSNITISHTGGQLSSDSGLVLVKELMNIFGFSELAKQHIHIEDERAYFTHDNLSILEQFIMQLIAGYSADSAANLLRQDPVFKTLQQNRVVYKVDEDVHVVEIYSARTHYESQ